MNVTDGISKGRANLLKNGNGAAGRTLKLTRNKRSALWSGSIEMILKRGRSVTNHKLVIGKIWPPGIFIAVRPNESTISRDHRLSMALR